MVFESAAIALYLTDAFPQNGIGPVVGNTLRGAYLTWLAYYTGEMGPTFISSLLGLTANTAAVPLAPKDTVMAHVNRTLENGPYLLGETFSAADILVGSAFALFLGSPALPRTDLLAAYVDSLTARAAYKTPRRLTGLPASLDYNFTDNKKFSDETLGCGGILIPNNLGVGHGCTNRGSATCIGPFSVRWKCKPVR